MILVASEELVDATAVTRFSTTFFNRKRGTGNAFRFGFRRYDCATSTTDASDVICA